MLDDQLLPEVQAESLWSHGMYSALMLSDLRRMAAYVRQAAGMALAIEAQPEIWELPPERLFALALHAKRSGLNANVVGSLFVIAMLRGSTIALPALVEVLGDRLAAYELMSDGNSGDLAGRRELRRTIREVQARLRQGVTLDQFDKLKTEVAAAGDAVTVAEAWAQFRKEGVDGKTHRVVAPGLKNLRHIEGGEEAFRILAAPLPNWMPSVSAEVLAAVLALEFPHLTSVTADIAEFVVGGAAASLRPLLLVGPAAIGKDSIVRRAAELVGRPHGEFDLAGTSDNRILRGTSKGWSTAWPSYPVTVCALSRCANPLIQFSELDRAGGSRRNGQVHESLLALCEPSTRRKWHDDGLGIAVDLSEVAFVFTSNSVDDTPQPLLSRLRVIHLERPGPTHVAAILGQARRRYAAELKVRVEDLPELRPESVRKLKTVAQAGRFHLRLADRIVRVLGDGRDTPALH